MNTKRTNALNNKGIDTSKFFTLVANEDIPKGTKINIGVDATYEPIAKQIQEDGYVANTRLHRRWVAAQYLRMLNHKNGWHGYLNTCYGYEYQFDMMTEEVRVLAKLATRDREVYNERATFFDFKTIHKVVQDYVADVKKHLNGLPRKNCKGKPYVHVPKFGNCFVDELDSKIITPIQTMADICTGCWNYADMYSLLCALKKVMIKLPYNTRKSKAWVNAFQAAGAYYTLKNLIMFHGVTLRVGDFDVRGEKAMYILRALLGRYKGYQFNAMLKATIESNNFDLKKALTNK